MIDSDSIKNAFISKAQLNERNKGVRNWVLSKDEIWQVLDNFPQTTCDSVPTGYWEELIDANTWQCSNCGDTWRGGFMFTYCPTCGARMSMNGILF